jgi:hypothetical protein
MVMTAPDTGPEAIHHKDSKYNIYTVPRVSRFSPSIEIILVGARRAVPKARTMCAGKRARRAVPLPVTFGVSYGNRMALEFNVLNARTQAFEQVHSSSRAPLDLQPKSRLGDRHQDAMDFIVSEHNRLAFISESDEEEVSHTLQAGLFRADGAAIRPNELPGAVKEPFLGHESFPPIEIASLKSESSEKR